ncbi:MAG: MFS transporter [Pseudomonadota bacterium]
MTLRAFLAQNAPFLSVGMLLTFMSSFGQTFFISIFAGEIRLAYGLSHGAWGGIYTLGTGLSALVMIWAGALTDRFRVRQMGPVTLIGLAVACVGMAIGSAAWLLPFLVFALRLFGQGMSLHIATVAMARWFVAARGRALSIATLGVALGEALLPLSFVALMAFIDWRLLWLVAAAICLAGVWPVWRLLGQERTPQHHASGAGTVGMGGRHWARGEMLRHPLFWLMVPAILGPGAFNTAFFFHQVHLAETKGWAHVELVALFPLYTAVAVMAMVGSGWALDRVGAARLMTFTQMPLVLAYVLFAAATGTGAMIAGFVCLGLAVGAQSTLPSAFWAEAYGTAALGAIRAVIMAVMVLGSAIGPGITGLGIDLGFALEDQFLAIAAFFAMSTALVALGVAQARRAMGAPAVRDTA